MALTYPTGAGLRKDKAKIEKAMIVALDMPEAVLFCQFNPTQIHFSKNTTWSSGADKEGAGGSTEKQPKRNVPTSEFNGGGAQSLSMDLLFDTTEDSRDVREYTDFLMSLTLISPLASDKNARPPLVKFVWGEFSAQVPFSPFSTRSMLSFTAYVQGVDVTFTMFLPNGRPVRAEAKVTFTAQKDEEVLPFQNPTSRAEARTMHIVSPGETLDYIAYREYGDPFAWRHIAQTNQLLDPKGIKAGQVLKITTIGD